MGVYHIYTKTAHLPVYLVYKCQHCGSKVAAAGKYDFSVSYNDRGAFRRKKIAERAANATRELTDHIRQQSAFFQKEVEEVAEDYVRITCTCPKCGHGNLGKLGDRAKVERRVSLACCAVTLVLAVAMIWESLSFRSDDVAATIFGIIFGAFIVFSWLTMFVSWILKLIEKVQMKKICSKAAPLISMNKNLLIEAAKKRAVFRDTDFSAIL